MGVVKNFSTPKTRAISRPVDFTCLRSNETEYKPISLIAEVIEEINEEGNCCTEDDEIGVAQLEE